jgi:hypothetical protein
MGLMEQFFVRRTERLLVHRARFEVWRAEQRRLRRLRDELATFRSEADRRDLEAALERCPEGLTVEVRTILADQALARCRGPRPWRAVGGV